MLAFAPVVSMTTNSKSKLTTSSLASSSLVIFSSTKWVDALNGKYTIFPPSFFTSNVSHLVLPQFESSAKLSGLAKFVGLKSEILVVSSHDALHNYANTEFK